MHRYDGPCPSRNGGLDFADVHAETIVAIDQHSAGPDLVYGANGSHKGVGRGNDLVARPNADRLEREFQRVGTGTHPDRMLRANEFCKTLLEVHNGLAERELTRRQESTQFL